jgi:polysaccharide biosynthesis protein PslA
VNITSLALSDSQGMSSVEWAGRGGVQISPRLYGLCYNVVNFAMPFVLISVLLSGGQRLPAGVVLVLASFASLIMSGIMRGLGHSQPNALISGWLPLEGIVVAAGSGVAGMCLGLTALGHPVRPLFAGIGCLVAAGGLLLVSAAFRIAGRSGRQAGWLCRNLVLVGAGAEAEEFIARAGRGGNFDRVVGVFSDGDGLPSVLGAPRGAVYGGLAQLMDLLRRRQARTVVIAASGWTRERLRDLLVQMQSVSVDLFLLSDVPSCAAIHSDPALTLIGTRPMSNLQSLQKRVFDIAGASVLLAFIGPILILVAAMVKLDSQGPALFRQPRLGLNDVPFQIFKFRTMFHASADLLADRQTSRNDPRVTRLGHWLRKFSIDELPQLLNVLKGDMSLVGPRPHAPNTRAGGLTLPEAFGDYNARQRVKPGITGWAQVCGSRGELQTEAQLRRRVRYDLFYIRNWSIGLDCRILVLTVLREIFSRRAF